MSGLEKSDYFIVPPTRIFARVLLGRRDRNLGTLGTTGWKSDANTVRVLECLKHIGTLLDHTPLTKLVLALEDVDGDEDVRLAPLKGESVCIVATTTSVPSSAFAWRLVVIAAAEPRLFGPLSWSHTSRRGREMLAGPATERVVTSSFASSRARERDATISVFAPLAMTSPTPTSNGMLDKSTLISATPVSDVLGIGVGA